MNNIEDIQYVNEIVQDQLYIQSGGMPMVVAKIGEFLMIIVMAIVRFLINLFKALFKFRFELSFDAPFFATADVGEGLFYKFCWMAIKAGFYLAVFAFGGPLLILAGIGFLYKNLFEKFKELKKGDNEKENEGEDSGGDGGDE